MTPAARLQAAIDILGGLAATGQPADRYLRDFFRTRRYAGSKDRAAVAERVYAVLRHRYSLAWRMGGDDPRRLVLASLLKDGENPETYFGISAYAPPALTAAESSALATTPPDPPLHIQGEFPPWLEPELSRAFGPELLPEMQAMLSRAPIDLRANTLKTSPAILAEALAREGFAAEPTPWSPTGLRLASGHATSKLSASPLFATGQFEFQDEAAQIAAILCAAHPGMRVLDFAAGAGGKSLALAAAMQNSGEITAHDIARLDPLAPRAQRAGVGIILPRTEPPTGLFDVVLFDSPCSGTGTWRRQPELRWRLTPEKLAELTALQSRLLTEAAAYTAPGGHFVYATCSLLPCENEDQIAQFLAAHSDFAPISAAEVWRTETGREPPPGMNLTFRATPHTTATDGFFTAVLQRHR